MVLNGTFNIEPRTTTSGRGQVTDRAKTPTLPRFMLLRLFSPQLGEGHYDAVGGLVC